ncbi:MAG: alpha/beta fold hydrolase [Actinomycetota bacterium]|nr:alpha/beta fold hydrolase [Actinomycetota bacterium]
MNRVMITGIGIIAPSGIGKEEFWRNNTGGAGFLSYEPEMEAIGIRSRVVSRVAGWAVADHNEPAVAASLSRLSRFAQFGVTVGAMAARDAGLQPVNGNGQDSRPESGDVDYDRAGVVFSSAIGGTPEFQDAYEKLSDRGAHQVDPFPEDSCFYDSVFLNYAPAWTAKTFGLRGPCTSLTTGCTAGIDAMGLGFDLVRHGDLGLVVAAAAEAPLSGISYATLDVIGSLAVGDWPPERASRPFDARRGGFVLGEGAAAVVLEDLDHAIARGARIYGEILGYASLNNAHHMTDLAPDGAPMAAVLRRLVDDAGVPAQLVDYVNAHGSSTGQNDLFETQALKTVLGGHAYRIPVSSTKSMIGHSLSAASLTGVIATIGAIQSGMVPPTANYEFPDPDCDLDYVPNVAREHHVGAALVMASGFGGIHSAALLRRPALSDLGHPDLATYRLTGAGVMTPAGAQGASADGESVAGPPGTQPALFLHGFGGTAQHWEALGRELRDEVDCFAVDLPGHGRSTGTGLDWPGRELTGTLAQLAGGLPGGPPEGGVGIVAHSFGALVALRLAIMAPHRVAWLALLATGLPTRLHHDLVDQLRSGHVDPDFLAEGLTPPVDPDVLGLIADGFRHVRLPARLAEVWGVRLDQSDLGDLSRVRVPTLVVLAERDNVTSPRKGRALAAALGATQAGLVTVVTVPQAGHYLHIEQPAAVARLIRSHAARAGLTGRPGPRQEVLR